MSDRASLSLIELTASLSSELSASVGTARHSLGVELAQCYAEQGDLGAAFRVLWVPEETPDPDQRRLLARAELQARCGNEDAALALVDDIDEAAAVARARAGIAATRGDWPAVLHWATQAPEGAWRILSVARAHLALGDRESAGRALDELAAEGPVESLHAALLRALVDGSAVAEALPKIAARARERGALWVEAEAWTELCSWHRARDASEASRAAAGRALELWDEIAMTLPPPLRAGFWCDVRRQAVRSVSRPSGPPRSPDPATARGFHPLLASLRQLASERDLSQLLALITDRAVELSAAERGFVLLVDESGRLEPRTIRVAEEHLGKQTAAFSRSIAETVLIDREPVITVDAAHDARVQDYMSVHQLMLKSVACLPIETRGRTWGVLYLEHRSASGRFSGTDLAMLRAFADQAAITIETADLLARVESQRRDLERANEALRHANAELEQRLEGKSAALERTRVEIARLQGSTVRGDRWGLVGVSEGMQRVYQVLERVAANDVPVVITGESGTGKELVALAIHEGSRRAEAPCVSLSCGSIPEGLLESELFGHVAGAFTGATRGRDGVFVQANGGTLFMDEIADMPARMQLDLLRVLQERRVRPVGASEETEVDVRLITACKQSLRTLVATGQLREDLYYRLAVVELELPPLRERRGDIPLLCEHFLTRIARDRGEPKKRLSRSALERLGSHDFPGNVRELEHLLISASVFAEGDVIEADQLAIDTALEAPKSSSDPINYRDFKNAERDRILGALNANDWNRARAARSLGMPRRTFYRRLKQHGIELPSGQG